MKKRTKIKTFFGKYNNSIIAAMVGLYVLMLVNIVLNLIYFSGQ